jgi:hypothetical protein
MEMSKNAGLRQEIILFFSTHPLTPLPPRQLSQTQND